MLGKLDTHARGKDAFVAVGSNIRPEENIQEALRMLSESVTVVAVSTFYKSAPKDAPAESPFSNGVFRITATLEPMALKYEVLRGIEEALGRRRAPDKNAPREIDLDLILYDDLIVENPKLKIPDPDIYKFGFIAVPLAEVASDMALPDTGMRVEDLASAKDKEGLVPLEGLSSRLKRWLRHE